MGKSSKKNEGHETELRAPADAAVEAWRAAKAIADAAQKHFAEARAEAEKGRSAGSSLSAETRLALIVAELRWLEAEDVALAAKTTASAALDAAERAEGDALAVAYDLPLVHDELAALLAEEDRLRAALAAASRRCVDRLLALRETEAKWNARRSEAGLPPPERIPQRMTPLGHPDPRQTLLSLARILAEGQAQKSNAEKIARLHRLHREELEIRADLERQHREREEREAAAADYDRRREGDRQREQERWRKELEASRAKSDAERQLADAHRAREASS